ncbi:MAG: sensor domain-containing diguanylate cyclase, partial [Candidatus Omnitrophica bacterium]|nr:sensor domain-containing diguanylate cyclase [Candidatus Omnitrophota bacterium]
MDSRKSQHVSCLESASEGILRFSRSEQFMEWIVQSLFTHLKAEHVSIAIHDASRNLFVIRHSSGRKCIPKYLVALDQDSPIVRWFKHTNFDTETVETVEHPMTYQNFAYHITEDSPILLTELDRYHIDVCAKIETHERLIGYLLIGPQESGKLYTKDDLTYFQALANDIAIEIEKEEYYHSSHSDPLTGLWNRQYLDQKLDALMNRASQRGAEFAVAMLDLDNFKSVNDRFGHLLGDQVLKITAEMIRGTLRPT